MNNHYQGKELVNALQLKAELNQSKIRVPLLLAEHYPYFKENCIEFCVNFNLNHS